MYFSCLSFILFINFTSLKNAVICINSINGEPHTSIEWHLEKLWLLVSLKGKFLLLCFECSLEVSLHMCMLIHCSHVHLFATLWTVAQQAPLSLGVSRQEHGVGCHDKYSPFSLSNSPKSFKTKAEFRQ